MQPISLSQRTLRPNLQLDSRLAQVGDKGGDQEWQQVQRRDPVGLLSKWGDEVEERLVVDKLVFYDLRLLGETDQWGTDLQDRRKTPRMRVMIFIASNLSSSYHLSIDLKKYNALVSVVIR